MPSYSSPELQKSHKKPRPKSLAISTPTRLLSLEEARERAFVGGLNPNQRYIDVGGGPDNLPAKYHTVIDLPGYRKKNVTNAKDSVKGKKSPVSGWKSFFSKPRSGSIRKSRKSSIQGDFADSVSLGGPRQAKALTEEDVHNWKKRLRSAKSAESLLSLASSSRSSSSRTSKANDNLMVVNVYGEEKHPSHHKRSLSSDATAILYHHSHDPSFHDGVREMPIDVDLSVTPDDLAGEPRQSRKSRSEKRTEPERKQSFIRGDSTRRALHRRTPSAPSTPQQERSSSGSRIPSHHKTASQPALESPNLRVIRNSDFHSSQESLDEDFVYHRPDQAHGNVKFVLRSENQVSKHVDSKSSSKSAEELTPKKRCAKTPPKGRKKARGNSGKNVGFASSDDEVLTLQLPESPGARRKVQSEMQNGGGDKSIPAQYFYSRHHDYAEILSDGENNSKSISDSKSKETLIMGSPTSMSDLIQQLDDQFTAGVQFHLYSDRSVPNNTEAAPAEIPDIQPCPQKEEGKTAPVVNIKTESLPKRPIEFREVGPHECKELRESETYGTISSEIQTLESSLQKMQQLQPQPKMSKCLSVPSDIAKSLENVNVGSQSDLLSSVTISELSQSVDSFNLSLCDDSPSMSDARRRRSASLDSLTDSPLSRTLREINLQIDNAFKRDVERALELEDRGYERHQSQEDFSPLHITEDLPTPTNPPESDFSDIPEYARIDKIKSTKQKEKSRDHNNLANGHETRSLPSEDIEIVSGNVNMACIPKTNSASDLDKCVMAPSPRKVHHKNEANNNEKQSYVDRQAEIHIVETPRVLRAPLRPPKQDGSESQMANIRARQESSSSSSESSDSTSDSEDDSESSVEIVCQQNSHPVNVAVAVNNQGQGYTESHLPECGSVNTAVRNSSPLFAPGIVGYISPTHQQTDIGIETLQWRQSPIFSDSGNQFGGASNRTSLARTSPVSSSCATSPAHIYGTSSASSVETSPRLSPRASPNFVTGIQETKMSPSADRLAPPEDHYHGASGGSPGLPVTSPHSSQQSLVEQNPVYYPPHFGSGFVANLPGNFHTSPSLPQVHVIHDTVTLEKPTIKRSTTESKLADRSAGQPLTGEYNEENYSSRTFPRKDSERKHNKRTPFQQQCDFSDHSRDKKCSKLTDVDCSIACQVADTDFHSQRPSSQLSANTVDYSIHSDCFSSNMPSRKDAGSDIVDTQSSHTSASFTVSPMLGCVHSSSQVMEVESSVEVSTNHSSPTVVESTYEKSEIQTSGPSVEAKMFRVESYGNVEPEVFQNAVNSGKELMMSKLSPNCSDIPNDQQKSQGSPVSVLVAAEPPTTSTCRAECKELSNAKNRNMSRKSNIPIPQPRGRARSPQAMHEQAPPNQEVMEVKRPTLKKRGQSPTSFRQDHIERTVVVKEITSEKGEAKLVIERRPNLKRNIQMVHARKVPHPPRQLAEAVDDMSDSVTPDLSSTGPSDPEPSGISSQEDEVFSDINDASSMQKSWHGYKSPRQDEHDVLIKEAGGMVQIGRTLAGKSGKPFKPTPKQFDDMIGSRSSLDESVLQLAAERHDTFGTDDSTPGNQGEYSTGSLRIKRSQKMQSLMDLFEKGSDQNLTLSSSPTFQVQESRLTSSLPSGDFCRLERDQDTDDESFLPVSRSNLPVNRRSRSRDRAQKRGAVGSDKENRLTSRSPTPNRHRPAMADRLQGTDSSTCPSSPAEVAREYRTKRKEKYSNFSKPPRYRSSSRGRTQSESSTSESEGSHYLDGSFHSRSSDLNASSGSDSILRDQNRSDTRTTHDWVERRSRLVRKDSDEGPPEQATVQRRGSIKELMDYFESKQYEQGDEESESTSGSTSTSTPTPTPTERRITRNRIRSVSPGQELVAPRDGIPGPGFRFSLELPSNAAMSLSDGAVKTQPLRLGPKPFYGSKK